MKNLIVLFMCAFISMGSAMAQESTLASGTAVPVRILTEIQSNSDFEPSFNAIVERDIYDTTGKKILIRRGTPVVLSGNVQRARGLGKPGSIKLTAVNTTAVDGRTIALMGGYEVVGASRKGTALGVGLGVGLTVCWPCMFCMCIKGEKVSIPENTVINNIVVDSPYIFSNVE